MVKHIVEHFSH